jgi:hypothetical protein
VRAADAAGSGVGLGDHQSRRLRAAEELGLPRSGRALMYCRFSATRCRRTTGRPAHVPPARNVDVRPVIGATPSSGRSRAIRTRRSSRLVLEGRPAGGRRCAT